jgi:hypothetical protein
VHGASIGGGGGGGAPPELCLGHCVEGGALDLPKLMRVSKPAAPPPPPTDKHALRSAQLTETPRAVRATFFAQEGGRKEGEEGGGVQLRPQSSGRSDAYRGLSDHLPVYAELCCRLHQPPAVGQQLPPPAESGGGGGGGGGGRAEGWGSADGGGWKLRPIRMSRVSGVGRTYTAVAS